MLIAGAVLVMHVMAASTDSEMGDSILKHSTTFIYLGLWTVTWLVSTAVPPQIGIIAFLTAVVFTLLRFLTSISTLMLLGLAVFIGILVSSVAFALGSTHWTSILILIHLASV